MRSVRMHPLGSGGGSSSGRKPWLVPLLGVLLVGALAWIGYSVFLTGGPVVLDSPKDQYMSDLRSRIGQDERFSHVEMQVTGEEGSTVLLFGEVAEEADAAALREAVGTPPEGVSVKVEVAPRP